MNLSSYYPDGTLYKETPITYISHPEEAPGRQYIFCRVHLASGQVVHLEPDYLDRHHPGWQDLIQDDPLPSDPFVLIYDGQMGSLRRKDGFTVIATMSKRTHDRIAQAKKQGADFYTLKAMFPKKHSVYNA